MADDCAYKSCTPFVISPSLLRFDFPLILSVQPCLPTTMAENLSVTTTLRETEHNEKANGATDRSTYSSPSASQFGPDPPPPPKAVQAMRWVKYNLKHSFKAGSRPYNPHSGF
jgi:hypothetical protein